MSLSLARQLGTAVLVVWTVGLVNLFPLPYVLVKQLQASVAHNEDQQKSPDAGTLPGPGYDRAERGEQLKNAITVIWATWLAEASVIGLGIFVGIRVVKGAAGWVWGAAITSTTFLLSWVFGFLFFDQAPWELFLLLGRNLANYGTPIEQVLFLIRNVVLPICHAMLVCLIVFTIIKTTRGQPPTHLSEQLGTKK